MTSVKHGPPPAMAPAEGRTSPATGGGSRGHGWALAGICVLAGLLYVWDIGSSDYGNAYYTSAAKSMTHSLTNFLFGAFDPYGLVSTDKPPMSMWPQAISVAFFGFHSWSVLLPQVVEGVLAVFLLHRTVRLWAGENVALLAALIFALTPISVAIYRDNNTDSLLVLLLVAAAYALTRSVLADGRSRSRWLYLCAFLVGCGFITKWMQAWIIVPGLALAYWVGSRGTARRRLADLLKAGVVFAVSSFWWPVLHDVWPGDKPFVAASSDGSALQVIFGYNGFGKIFDFGQRYSGSGINVPLDLVGMGGGNPDVARMFAPEVGGQISWLLPLSLLVLVVVGATEYRRLWFEMPGDPEQRTGWVLWGSWLVVTGLVFSFVQGIWHPYYTTMLAPAIAAIAAAGVPVLWRRYRDSSGYGWVLLPLAVAATAAWASVLIARDGSWHGWARWVVVGTAVVAVAGLLAGRMSAHQRHAVGRPALALGLASALFAPAVWSVGTAVEHGTNGGFPSAGPPNAAFNALLRGELPPKLRSGAGLRMPPGMQPPPGMQLPPGMQPPPGMQSPAGMPLPAMTGPAAAPIRGGIGGAELSAENRRTLDYAVRNSGDAEIDLAVEGGGLAASSFIIGSDATVIGMGGYLGADEAPTVAELQRWVEQGTLKFVLSAAPGGPRLGGMAGMGGEVQRKRVTWIEQNCQVVDPAAYGGSPVEPDRQLPIPGFGDATLYRCG